MALTRWTKHGFTTLVVPGPDPLLDITTSMDVESEPGPEESNTVREKADQLTRQGETWENVLSTTD